VPSSSRPTSSFSVFMVRYYIVMLSVLPIRCHNKIIENKSENALSLRIDSKWEKLSGLCNRHQSKMFAGIGIDYTCKERSRKRRFRKKRNHFFLRKLSRDCFLKSRIGTSRTLSGFGQLFDDLFFIGEILKKR
jgi:hypothetical protein